MGATSSSLSELATNEHLLRLSSSECISSNDPFWNQLLSFTFQIPRTSSDQRLLEESTSLICKNFTINNCRTGNFGALIHVFVTRAAELKASAECDDSVFTWQTYNSLFFIRNLCKYFVENLSDAMVNEQFEAQPPRAEAEASHELVEDNSVAELLINCLIEVLVDVPLRSFTYALHLESVSTLLILLSIQMYQPTPASHSSIYRHFMQGKCSIHACVFMKTLLQHYTAQEKAPAELCNQSNNHGFIYKASTAVATGLFSMMTLGIGPRLMPQAEVEEVNDKLLANHSLLLMLVLANHCTSSTGLHNPYRQALLSCTNSQDPESASSPSAAVASFKTDYTVLYDTVCKMLKDDQSTLFLYILIHGNISMKTFIMSRTNIDHLVLPLLRILYNAQERNSHHIYMALIVLLVLSEDECFNKAVHEINLKNVDWFKERAVGEISLGGLLILVVIRTIQYNMTRMRDKYLHTNCLAALANMSAQFANLHPYVSQRIVSLFGQLQKKHTRLVEQIKNNAVETPVAAATDDQRDSDPESEQDFVQDLGVLEEVIRMVLEIINSTLTFSLQHNGNLLYSLLYHKHLFQHFRTHPTFQDIIQNIETVLSFFSTRLEKCDKSLSPSEVTQVIKDGALQFRKDRLKKFPELKFKYVEEEQPEEFFIPYVWSLVYHSSSLYFNTSRISIFSLNSPS